MAVVKETLVKKEVGVVNMIHLLLMEKEHVIQLIHVLMKQIVKDRKT